MLTKIGNDGEKINYHQHRKLRDELISNGDELISNAIAIPLDIEERFSDHLFLVVYDNV